METICDLYCKYALASIVSEMKEELGKESRTIISNAARKRLGVQMIDMLNIKDQNFDEKNLPQICQRIMDSGGPCILCSMDNGNINMEIQECHMLEAAKIEPFICEITHGWIEALLNEIGGDIYVVERVQTIVQGARSCKFVCKKNYESATNATIAIKRIMELQKRISNKTNIIMEFLDKGEFNDFSIRLQSIANAEIKNVSIFQDRYVVEVQLFSQATTRIR
jgi:predicted hydrocarbon binding protein